MFVTTKRFTLVLGALMMASTAALADDDEKYRSTSYLYSVNSPTFQSAFDAVQPDLIERVAELAGHDAGSNLVPVQLYYYSFNPDDAPGHLSAEFLVQFRILLLNGLPASSDTYEYWAHIGVRDPNPLKVELGKVYRELSK